MTIAEVRKFIEENKESDEVKGFLDEVNPLKQATKENAFSLIEGVDALKAAVDSYADKRVTEGIKTHWDKNFEKEHRALALKENPPKSEADKRIAELELKWAEADKMRNKEAQEKLALRLLTESGMPIRRAGQLAGETEEETKTRVADYMADLKDYGQNKTDQMLSQNGRKVQSDMKPKKLYSIDELKSMGDAGINKLMATEDGKKIVMESLAASGAQGG
jgi:hypothetical protein